MTAGNPPKAFREKTRPENSKEETSEEIPERKLQKGKPSRRKLPERKRHDHVDSWRHVQMRNVFEVRLSSPHSPPSAQHWREEAHGKTPGKTPPCKR